MSKTPPPLDPSTPQTPPPTNIISLDTHRVKKMEERRKNQHRVIFQNVFSTYAVLSETLMIPVFILDFNNEGVAFYVKNQTHPAIAQPHLRIRIYLTRETYFEVEVAIRNTRDMVFDGSRSTRYGCSVDPGQPQHHVYRLMVEFMTKYAQTATIDRRF